MAAERHSGHRKLAPSGTSPGGKGWPGRFGPALAGGAAGLFVLALYLRTLAPTVLYYDDPDMLAKVSRGLGKAMKGQEIDKLDVKLAERGW